MDSAQRCDNGPSFEGVSSSFNEDSSVRRKKSHNWMESSRGEDRSVTTEGQQAGDLIFQNITLWSGGRNCRRRSPINGHFCRSIQQQRNCNWDGTGRRQTPHTGKCVFSKRPNKSTSANSRDGLWRLPNKTRAKSDRLILTRMSSDSLSMSANCSTSGFMPRSFWGSSKFQTFKIESEKPTAKRK